MRTGIGYDIHRLENGIPLMLAGVCIDHPQGLLGHSDGDVVIHALCDALLGATGLGDIGEWFPDTNPQWKGVASTILLEQVQKHIAKTYAIMNIDINIFAERPKLQVYKQEMVGVMANILHIETSQINIKAKTNEALGPIGRGEAIAAQAIVLVQEFIS